MNDVLSLITELQRNTHQIFDLIRNEKIELAQNVIEQRLIISTELKKLIDKNPEYKHKIQGDLFKLNVDDKEIIFQLEAIKNSLAEKITNINKLNKAVDVYRANSGEV